MKHQIEWFKLDEPYDSIGFHSYDPTDDLEAYLCPLCGARTHEWEGQIDETPLGEAIYGYSYDCYACGIHSAAQELP